MKKLIICALLSTLALAGCVGEKKNGGEINSLSVGMPMPAFSVANPDGSTVSSDDLAGERSVIVFFRTTCPDCSREMPNVNEAYAQLIGSGVRFVTISKEDNAATAVPEYWKATNMLMPWYLDPAGDAFTAFGVGYVPTIYLFGSDGKVAHVEVETFGFSVEGLIEMILALE
jgi:peroxiredoxin